MSFILRNDGIKSWSEVLLSFLMFRCLHTRVLRFRCLHTRVLMFSCLHTSVLKFRCLYNRILKFRCLHVSFLSIIFTSINLQICKVSPQHHISRIHPAKFIRTRWKNLNQYSSTSFQSHLDLIHFLQHNQTSTALREINFRAFVPRHNPFHSAWCSFFLEKSWNPINHHSHSIKSRAQVSIGESRVMWSRKKTKKLYAKQAFK